MGTGWAGAHTLMSFAPSPIFCCGAAPAEGTGGRPPAQGQRCPRSASQTASDASGCSGPGRKRSESKKVKEASPRPPLPAGHRAPHPAASGIRTPARGCLPCAGGSRGAGGAGSRQACWEATHPAGPRSSRPAETCWPRPRLGVVAGTAALPSHQLCDCPWVSPFPRGLRFPICRGTG